MALRLMSRRKNWKGVRVLVRADFNVPFVDGVIRDDYKILRTLPTLKFLLKQGATVIVMSHLGRPQGYNASLSLRPIADHLSTLLKRDVQFIDPVYDDEGWSDRLREATYGLKPPQLILLENIRFLPGEEGVSKTLSRHLASVADVMVMDGFGVAHRSSVSVTGVARILPTYAGLLLEEEITGANALLAKPRRPLLAVQGGAKLETKLPLIKELLHRSDAVLLGGALVRPFLAAEGLLSAPESAALFPTLRRLLKKNNLILPRDFVLGTADGKEHVVVMKDDLASFSRTDLAILDVGPATAREYARLVSEAKTVLWNGVLGKFEHSPYDAGTRELLKGFKQAHRRGARIIVGGGETAEFIRAEGGEKFCTLISTGGGALLEFIARQGKLPGTAIVTT